MSDYRDVGEVIAVNHGSPVSHKGTPATPESVREALMCPFEQEQARR